LYYKEIGVKKLLKVKKTKKQRKTKSAEKQEKKDNEYTWKAINWEAIKIKYANELEKNIENANINKHEIDKIEKRLMGLKKYKDMRFAGNIELIIKHLLNNKYKNKIYKVYVFGSYAYGTPNWESDIDICAIVQNNVSWPDAAFEMTKTLCHEKARPINILVITVKEFEERKETISIEKVINKNGIIVYERQ